MPQVMKRHHPLGREGEVDEAIVDQSKCQLKLLPVEVARPSDENMAFIYEVLQFGPEQCALRVIAKTLA